MTWNRPAASAALVSVLTTATSDLVTVHPQPPSTLNAPALVVSYPTTVTKHVPTFAIDEAELAVLGAVGVEEGEALDTLLATAVSAVEADPSLGHAVQHCKPVSMRNWRIHTTAGAALLVAELLLEIRM